MKRTGAPPGRAQSGLVLLHGRGGSAADILGLLGPLALPDVAGIAPEAPGNSWWPTSFLDPTARMEPYVTRGLAAVAEAIVTLQGEGLPRNRIWLCGFSQGACLALESFARAGDGLAGVFGLSGGLVGTGDAPGDPQADLYDHGPKDFDYPEHRPGSRAWISVHRNDPHIPLARVIRSIEVLSEMGARVEHFIQPGQGHSVFQQDLSTMRRFLKEHAV